MTSRAQAEAFVERFTELWGDPDPEGYGTLWHEDGQLLHPGMEAPTPAAEIPAYVARLQSLIPDIKLEPTRWVAEGDTVFIEWVLRGTFNGKRHEVSGVDRFTLRGDRATEGIAWFDTAVAWKALEGEDRRDLFEEAEARVATTS